MTPITLLLGYTVLGIVNKFDVSLEPAYFYWKETSGDRGSHYEFRAEVTAKYAGKSKEIFRELNTKEEEVTHPVSATPLTKTSVLRIPQRATFEVLAWEEDCGESDSYDTEDCFAGNKDDLFAEGLVTVGLIEAHRPLNCQPQRLVATFPKKRGTFRAAYDATWKVHPLGVENSQCVRVYKMEDGCGDFKDYCASHTNKGLKQKIDLPGGMKTLDVGKKTLALFHRPDNRTYIIFGPNARRTRLALSPSLRASTHVSFHRVVFTFYPIDLGAEFNECVNAPGGKVPPGNRYIRVSTAKPVPFRLYPPSDPVFVQIFGGAGCDAADFLQSYAVSPLPPRPSSWVKEPGLDKWTIEIDTHERPMIVRSMMVRRVRLGHNP